MSRVDLGDGSWAELHAPRKVSERKRRTFITAMTAFQQSLGGLPRDDKGETDPRMYGPDQQQLLDAAMDLLVIALVSAWSFEQPVSVDALADFPVDVFDALRCACTALQGELLPDYEVSPDPKAGTAGSTILPSG